MPLRFAGTPALGGRGTEREAICPRSGILTLLFGPAARFGMFSAGRCAPRLLPICVVGLPELCPADAGVLRLATGGAIRLTTGRAKLRGGGMADDLAAFAPSIVVFVGLTSSARTGVTLLNWLGEIRTAFRATGCEFTNVVRETAVNPFGACMFA
jgi:hypothetical protein